MKKDKIIDTEKFFEVIKDLEEVLKKHELSGADKDYVVQTFYMANQAIRQKASDMSMKMIGLFHKISEQTKKDL